MSEVAEAVAENVEETIDGVVDVIEVVRNNPMALALCAGVGVLIGAGVGYMVARKTLEAEFEEALQSESEKYRVFYERKLHKKDENGEDQTPQDVLREKHPEAAAAADALAEYQGQGGSETPYEAAQDEALLAKTESKVERREVAVETPEGPATVVTEKSEHVNVFMDDTFDLDEEMRFRTKDKPYIITHDEFFEKENNYEDVQYVFYENDSTLVDERGKPVIEVDKMVGEDHLARFGHGSKDRNVVYVRSDRLEMDFEITRSTGSYTKEVLGFDDDDDKTSLRHSERRREFRRGEG